MSNSPSPTRRLSATPKLTPSSPKRRPLHQRSNLQTNPPTIRIVTDSASQNVYNKSPFPTQPNQILQPRYAPFGDRGRFVSDENTPTNRATVKSTKGEALVPGPLQTRKSNRASTSTITSDPDTSFSNGSPFSPSSSHFSEGTSPPSSPIEEDHATRLTPVHEELTPGRAKSQPTIRAVPPSPANNRDSLANKQSATSLASSASSDTLSVQKQQGRRRSSTSSRNVVVYPYSSSASLGKHSSTGSLDYPLPQLPTSSNWTRRSSVPSSIPNYSSVESLAFSDASYSSNAERPRSSSSPAFPSHAGLRGAYKSGAKVQFPSIRAPSASGLRADVPGPTLQASPRMSDGPYRPPPWSSRLSTIASQSTEQTSESNSSNAGQYLPRRRRTVGSVTSEGVLPSASEEMSSVFEEGSGVLTGSESNISIPYPPALFSANMSRPLPAIPGEEERGGRDSDERDDVVGELQSPRPLREQRSGFLSRFTSRSRPSSSDSAQSHASSISFIGDLSWAKRYYSNGEPANLVGRSLVDLNAESGSSARLNTATSGQTTSPVSETFPGTLWRPRNRPPQGAAGPSRLPRTPRTRDTAITEVSETDTNDRRRRRSASLSVTEMMFSPHLGRDRRATARYSNWQVPSMEDSLFGKGIFGPTNRQVLLFCLGFICPLTWMLAAFLPLPKRPPTYQTNPVGEPSASGGGWMGDTPTTSTAQVSTYGNHVYPHSVVPSERTIEEKRWHKAYWWRTVNRILSVLGLLIIGAVIALAIIGTRMKKEQSAMRNTSASTLRLR